MTRAKDRAKLEFDKMPDVSGDPIVESGSNSDGEWTRWADGTQTCTSTEVILETVTTVTSGLSHSDTSGRVAWVFPATFTNVPSTSASVTNLIDAVMTYARSISMCDYQDGGSLIALIDIDGDLGRVNAKAFASGRWK